LTGLESAIFLLPHVVLFPLSVCSATKQISQRSHTVKSTVGLVFRRLMLLAAVAVLLAYPASRFGVFEWPRAYDPLALPDLALAPGILTGWQMRLVDLQPTDCALVLQRVGLAAVLKPAKNAGSSCEVSGAIAVSRFSTARIKPEDMRCAMAVRLYVWERHVLQPAARRLLGEDIVEVLHFGSFSCRTMRGRSNMSEHATANAFDIAGFRTKSGKVISVKRDWNNGKAEDKFLHTVRDGLCNWFNATLSPDYNADHADHFHVDMGAWPTCR
jgi:hypothetical protein